MNALYVAAGIGLLLFGIWLTIKKLKVFLNKKQDDFGGDINLLGVGVISIIGGIILIFQHI